MKTSETKAIRQTRIRARAESREGRRTYCQILDDVARANGHGTWKEMRRANPTTVIDFTAETPWKARVRYAVPIADPHRQAFAAGIEVDPDEDGDRVVFDLVCGLRHSRPAGTTWTDDTTVEFGAMHRHHALGILACLPRGHLSDTGAVLEIEHDGTVEQVRVAPVTEERWSQADGWSRNDGMVFRSDGPHPMEWEWQSDDRMLASTAWDWLLELAGMDDAGFVGEVVSEMREGLDDAPFAYVVMKANADTHYGMIHPAMPMEIDDVLKDWKSMPSMQWRINIGKFDTTLGIGVTRDGASYLFRGHDYCFHVEETGDPHDIANPLARNRISMWWRTNPDDPHGTPPLAMHQRGAPVGMWTSRSEDRVLEQLRHMHVLGELPQSERPLLVPVSMNRGVALMGEYVI